MTAARKYPPFETREKIERWCAMQERSHFDTRRKLASWGVPPDEQEQIVSELIGDNFLNEERFARAFASGRFKIKKWGWNKIENHLRQKKVSKYSIELAREEIDRADYLKTLAELIEKKSPKIKADSDWEHKQKILRYATTKGYSAGDVFEVLGED